MDVVVADQNASFKRNARSAARSDAIDPLTAAFCRAGPAAVDS
jgi:hypothetical protein